MTADARPAWKEFLGPILLSALLILIPEIPALKSAVAFERALRVPLALSLGASLVLGRLGVARPVMLLLSAALRAVFLVATRKPGSLLWSMMITANWENARDPRSGRWDAALFIIEPVAILAGFLTWGGIDNIFIVPWAMTMIGPLMHFGLKRQARRIRTMESQADALRLATLRMEADRQRAAVLADVHATLGAQLRGIAAATQSAERAISSGESIELATLTRQVRDATLELRGAIWAFDPSEDTWEVVEARLRRIVAEMGGLTLRADIPADRRLTPADRVALLRSVREALPKVERGELLIRSRDGAFEVSAGAAA
jgi:hypothetical protein